MVIIQGCMVPISNRDCATIKADVCLTFVYFNIMAFPPSILLGRPTMDTIETLDYSTTGM